MKSIWHNISNMHLSKFVKGNIIMIKLFVVAFVVYGVTAQWAGLQAPDNRTSSLAAWNLVHSGSVEIPAEPFLNANGEYLPKPLSGYYDETKNSIVTQYPPGITLFNIPPSLFSSVNDDNPCNLVDVDDGNGGMRCGTRPQTWVYTLWAVFLMAASLAMLYKALSVWHSNQVAIVTSLLVGFGTPIWVVAAEEMFVHTADVFLLSAGFLLLSKNRNLGSSAAFAALALARPHALVIGGSIKLAQSIKTRNYKYITQFLGFSALFLGTLVGYNKVVHGNASISGGYTNRHKTDYQSTILDFSGDAMSSYISNIWKGIHQSSEGIIFGSPTMIPLIIGLIFLTTRKGWLKNNWVEASSAIGGLGYLAVQYKLHRSIPGIGPEAWRYQIEAIYPMSLLLAVFVSKAISNSRSYATYLMYAIATLAVANNAIAAFTH